MIVVKTPQFGQSEFHFGCDVCKQPITNAQEAFVLFDMEKSLSDNAPVFMVHKDDACKLRVKNLGKLQSKDFTEFLELLSS